MGTYEVLCILPVNLAEGDLTSTIDEFRGMAEKAGAKTVKEDAWGRRRLAYPINKQSDGVYHLYVFEAEPGSLSDLDRRMRNSDNIMRHMIVRTDLETRRARKKGLLTKGEEGEAAGEEASPESKTKSPKQKTELSADEAVEAKKKAGDEAPIKAEAGPVEPESETEDETGSASEEE